MRNDKEPKVSNVLDEEHPQLEPLLTFDLGNNVKLEMVRIPAGSFLMGSPEDEVG